MREAIILIFANKQDLPEGTFISLFFLEQNINYPQVQKLQLF